MDASGRKIEAGRLWRAAQRLCDENEHIVWAGRPGREDLIFACFSLAGVIGLLGFVIFGAVSSINQPFQAGISITIVRVVVAAVGVALLSPFLLLWGLIAADHAHRLHVITSKCVFTLHWGPFARFTRKQSLPKAIRFLHRSQGIKGYGTLYLRRESGEPEQEWKGIASAAEAERLYRQTFACDYGQPSASHVDSAPDLDRTLLDQPVLTAELRSGERVLWVDKPSQHDFYTAGYVPHVCAAWLFILGGVFVLITAAIQFTQGALQLADLLGMSAFCVASICLGAWVLPDYKRSKRSILDWRYAITDRRAILIQMHPKHHADVLSFRPDRVRNARIERDDETDSLVFLDMPQVSGKGRRLDPKPIGFIAVADLDGMLAVITQAFGPLHSMNDEQTDTADTPGASHST